MTQAQTSARGAIIRSALFFSPFLAVTLIALVLILVETVENGFGAGRVVGLVLVGAVALLLGYQVTQSVRDLFARPVETTGAVDRRWSRNEFFLFRNGYIFVERNVFRLTPEQYIDIDIGDMVRITHYPHTSTVERIEVVERTGQANG